MFWRKSDQRKFDFVFWGHGHNEIERFLPLMVEMEKQGFSTMLFFSDYAFRPFSILQKSLIKKFSLNVCDFSDYFSCFPLFLLNSLHNLISSFIDRFPDFSNIFRIRYFLFIIKLIKDRIFYFSLSEQKIRGLLLNLGHSVNVFDLISLEKFRIHPYGLFFVKKQSTDLKIKSVGIPHGSPCLFSENPQQKSEPSAIFDLIFLTSELERTEKNLNSGTLKDIEKRIKLLGDPRFDSNWKKIILDYYKSSEKFLTRGDNLKIVYVSSNLEYLGLIKEKDGNLRKVAEIIKEIEGSHLYIKPHPRYRRERQTRENFKKIGFPIEQYTTLEDGVPLVGIIEEVDLIISSGTSALYDFLPEFSHKIVIFDDYSEPNELKNIFSEFTNFFQNKKDLEMFIKNNFLDKKGDEVKKKIKDGKKILEFCKKWFAGNGEVDEIVARYCEVLKMEKASKN
ncbi:hypothetical protein ACFL35_16000 [Candidatus Riflebacteria bacterium]